MNDLGNLLRKLRGKRALRDVAEATGLSHSYIADVEHGFRRGTKQPINPSPETLKRLSDAYNFPYEELMRVAGYLEDEIDSKDKGIFVRESDVNYTVVARSKNLPPQKIKQLEKLLDLLFEEEDDNQ